MQKIKKFVFVNLSINCEYNTGINHGIAYLVLVVRKHGYEVATLNIRKNIKTEYFISKIKELNPDIVAFSTTSNQIKYLIKYSTALRDCSSIFQIAGGVGCTLEPENILFKSGVEGVCLGEGEIPLNDLLDRISRKNNIYDTEGFYWRINGRIKENSVPQFFKDLSVLDLPDYSVFENSIIEIGGRVLIMISRGCPCNCYYCCNRALSGIYPFDNGYFRTLPVENGIRVIENVLKQCPKAQFIEFEDDLLIANKVWFFCFTEEYRNRIKLPYRIYIRVEFITKEIVRTLKESGCKWVYLGLESGDEPFRSKFLNRKYSNSMLIEKCKLIKKSGLKVFTFNMVGLPYETKKEMMNTYNLNKTVAPDSGVCTFFYLYKNTELYRICQEKDLLISEKDLVEITNYNAKPAIKMTKQQEKECIAIHNKLSSYLSNKNELGEIRDLPFGFKKYLKVLRYWVKALLRTMLYLDRLIRNMYFLLKTRALTMVRVSEN